MNEKQKDKSDNKDTDLQMLRQGLRGNQSRHIQVSSGESLEPPLSKPTTAPHNTPIIPPNEISSGPEDLVASPTQSYSYVSSSGGDSAGGGGYLPLVAATIFKETRQPDPSCSAAVHVTPDKSKGCTLKSEHNSTRRLQLPTIASLLAEATSSSLVSNDASSSTDDDTCRTTLSSNDIVSVLNRGYMFNTSECGGLVRDGLLTPGEKITTLSSIVSAGGFKRESGCNVGDTRSNIPGISGELSVTMEFKTNSSSITGDSVNNGPINTKNGESRTGFNMTPNTALTPKRLHFNNSRDLIDPYTSEQQLSGVKINITSLLNSRSGVGEDPYSLRDDGDFTLPVSANNQLLSIAPTSKSSAVGGVSFQNHLLPSTGGQMPPPSSASSSTRFIEPFFDSPMMGNESSQQVPGGTGGTASGGSTLHVLRQAKLVNSKFGDIRQRVLITKIDTHEDELGAAAIISQMRSSPYHTDFSSAETNSRPVSSSLTVQRAVKPVVQVLQREGNTRIKHERSPSNDQSLTDDELVGSTNEVGGNGDINANHVQDDDTEESENANIYNSFIETNSRSKEIKRQIFKRKSVPMIRTTSSSTNFKVRNKNRRKSNGQTSMDSLLSAAELLEIEAKSKRSRRVRRHSTSKSSGFSSTSNNFSNGLDRALSDKKVENKFTVNGLKYDTEAFVKKKAGSVTRSRTGCWICRLRKKKCSEERPNCSNCIRLNLECVYDIIKPDFIYDPDKKTEKLEEIKRRTKEAKRIAMKKKEW